MQIRTNSTYHQVKRASVTFAVLPLAGGSISGSPIPQTIDYGFNPVAGVTAVPAAGYAFTNWSYPGYTDLKGSPRTNATDPDYTTFTVYGPQTGLTLTANFAAIQYSITYDLNGAGATNHASNPADYYVTTSPITLQKPSRPGYHFTKWTNNSNATVTGIPTGSIGDTTFTAQWTQITMIHIPNDTVCNGVSVPSITFGTTMSPSPMPTMTYQWTNSLPSIAAGGALPATGSGPLPAFTAVNTGTSPLTDSVIVTPYADGIAGTPDTFLIVVNPTPVVNPVPNDTVCNQGAVAQIQFGTPVTGVTPAVTYEWTNDNTATGLAAAGIDSLAAFTAANNTTDAPIVSKITVTPKIKDCTGNPEEFYIVVNPTPQVNPIPSDTVCSGGAVTSVHFTTTNTGVTPAVSYHWSATNHAAVGLSAASGTGDITGITAPANTGLSPQVSTVTVTPKIGGCEGDPITFNIVVNPVPQVNAIQSDTVCSEGAVPTISFGTPITGVTPAVTYHWSATNYAAVGLPTSSGEGDITGFNAPANTGYTPQVSTVTVTPKIGNLCSGTTKTFNIVVNPAPVVNTVPNDTVCNGATATVNFGTLVTSSFPTLTYEWTNSNTAIGLTAASGTGNISFTAVNSGTAPVETTIEVTPYIGSCSGTAKQFKIVVNPTPQVQPLSNDTVCHNVTATVNFSTLVTGTTPPVSYHWTNDNTSIGLAGSGTGNISFMTVNTGATHQVATIVVTPKIGNSCSGSTETFMIVVNPVPQVNVIPSDTVCNQDAVSAVNFSSSVTGASPVIYDWTNDNTATGLAAAGTGNIAGFTATLNTTNAPQVSTVTVTPKIGGCSGSPKTFYIVVNPTPQVDVIPSDTVCNQGAVSTVNFTSSVTGATPVTYAWTATNHTDVGLLSASGTGDITGFTAALNTGTTPLVSAITVTPKIKDCTGPTKTFYIVVNPTPAVNTVLNDTVCNGTTASVTFGTPISGATPAVTYDWTNDTPSIGLAASGTGNISFTATNTGTAPVVANFTVTPYIGSLCSGTAKTFKIVVNPTATVNAISDTTYFDGQAVAALTATSPTSGVVFSWTNSNTAIGLAASGSGATIPAFTAANGTAGPITATVTVTPVYDGCTGTPETFIITVNPKPTITYDYDSGTPSATPNPTVYTVGVGATISNAPTRPGYMFAGWTCAALGLFTPQNPFVVPTTASSNLTILADWGAAILYGISYTMDGGVNHASNPANYDVNTGAITLQDPTKAGHTFVGWTGTDISPTLPQLDVTIPAAVTGSRGFTAHWSYQFGVDTIYACSGPVPLQSGHDGQSCEWILPDGSTRTTADLQATVSGRYILRTDYGARSLITSDTVHVILSFETYTAIRRTSVTGIKINLPQTFTVPINPELLKSATVACAWSFPGGTPASSTADTATVVYNSTGRKTITVNVETTRGLQVCRQTFTLTLTIYEDSRGFFVDQHVNGGLHDGSSWENAYLTIQEALANTTTKDCIWVAKGVYAPPTGASFLLSCDSVEIYGGFGGWETVLSERDFAANATILQGAGTSVVTTANISALARWDGFIVEGGNAVRGGGFYNDHSSVTIANTIIRGNAAGEGGGIYSAAGNPVLYNVEISGNTAGEGGGMYNHQAAPVLTNVTISGNQAETGGGLYNTQASPVVRNTIVWGNMGGNSAPNIHNNGSAPAFSYSLIEGSNGSGGNWNVAYGVDGGHNPEGYPLFRKNGFDANGNMQQGDYRLSSSDSRAFENGRMGDMYEILVRWGIQLRTLRNDTRVFLPYDLEGKERVIYDVVDIGAYEFEPEERGDVTIQRMVLIPSEQKLTTDPSAGYHHVESHHDFVFTVMPEAGYSLEHLTVITGIPLRDREGVRIVHHADGSATVTLLSVTESLVLSFSDIVITVSNDRVTDDRVWAYRNHLYLDATKESDVWIYTLSGQLYKQLRVGEGETAVPLPQGVYTVIFGEKVYKVITTQ
jgi:uncharacterized repeat protein (TIGR02543 family)